MGLGGYTFCEWKSVRTQYPQFQRAFAQLEQKMIQKCNVEWAPKTFGYLVPRAGQYGRTTILPELFNDRSDVNMTDWRQSFATNGHQTIITGNQTGNTIPEEFKVAWIGLAFPNKEQHVAEVKWQIGDRKYGRINLEELKIYDTPALIFEEGFIIDEETSFDLYGFISGEIPIDHQGNERQFQRIVMLGAAYYKIVDKVLGNTGAAIGN